MGGSSFDLRETGEKLGKTVFKAEILAVASSILTDQIDFADALRYE